jgi:hypothetical protein
MLKEYDTFSSLQGPASKRLGLWKRLWKLAMPYAAAAVKISLVPGLPMATYLVTSSK